jgi:hypothetical protein
MKNDCETSSKRSPKSNILYNIFTSGRPFEQDKPGMFDYLTRYILMNFVVIFGIIIFVFLIVLNIRKNFYMEAAICILMAVTGLIVFFIARTKAPQIVPAMIVSIVYALFCILSIWNGDAHGADFLFIYVYPPLSIMMLGKNKGILCSFILIDIAAILVFVPNLSNYAYPIDISSRMVAIYIFVSIIMSMTEQTRIEKDKFIAKLTHKLEKQNATLDQQRRELKNFNDNLQVMVDEKTKTVFELQDTILKTVADLVESRDTITGGHIERTQQGVGILIDAVREHPVYGQEAGGWNIKLLLQSSQLHDVGKIAISDRILLKP